MKRLFPLFMATMLLLVMITSTAHQAVSADSVNLMSNASAEILVSGKPTNWTADNWGASTTTMQPTTDAHTGSQALSITTTSRTSGDAKWTPDAVAVTGGQQYTYSDFYKSSVVTELDAIYTDANGAVTYAYIGAVNASTNWNQTTATFTVPASAKKVSIVHILPTNGNLTIDDVNLSGTATTPVTPPATGSNLITNPSFETASGTNPAGWQTGSWGTNNATFSYDQTGKTGSRSATVKITSYTDGDAKWYANPVTVTAGQTYTYTDSYKSTVATRIVIAYTKTDGSIVYDELAQAPAASAWTTYSGSLTAPAGAANVTIFHLLDRVGSLSLDDVSLVAGTTTTTPPTPTPTPLTIANSSVETSTNGTTPDNWESSSWGTNNAAFSYVNDAHTGSKSVKTTITSYTDGDAKWAFAPVSGLKDGQSYRFSAWVKASAQVHAVAAFTMADGSTKYQTLTLPTNFNSTAWTQYSAIVSTPTGAKSMTVYMLLSSKGWVQTDDYSIADYAPTGFNKGLVSLDFDDGWTNIYTNGLPLLNKYNFPSTQYIISSKIGTSGYMTTAQIKAFQAKGSEIGSHTVSHSDLTTLSASQLTTELSQSQATLRKNFGSSVATEIASPYGSYNASVLTGIKKYYTSHRSTDVGFNSKDNFNPYNIVVQNVMATTTNAQVKAWVDQALAQKTWLVLVYHQVENQVAAGDDDAVKTSDLDAQLNYIKSSGITVKTQAAALAEVNAQVK